MPEMAVLRDGTTLSTRAVNSIMHALNILWGQSPPSVVELVDAVAADQNPASLTAMTVEHAKRLYLLTPDGQAFTAGVSSVLASAWDGERGQLRNPVVSLTQK